MVERQPVARARGQSGQGKSTLACRTALEQLFQGLIFDPDLPKQAQARDNYKNGCNHCNECATLIEAPGGIYCVERPTNFA